jgi:hypothetical protein
MNVQGEPSLRLPIQQCFCKICCDLENGAASPGERKTDTISTTGAGPATFSRSRWHSKEDLRLSP